MYVDRSRVDGGTIYITGAVCMNCAKLISNSGLSRVVVMIGSKDDHRNPMEVLKYLRKCEIEVTVINTP